MLKEGPVTGEDFVDPLTDLAEVVEGFQDNLPFADRMPVRIDIRNVVFKELADFSGTVIFGSTHFEGARLGHDEPASVCAMRLTDSAKRIRAGGR